MKQYTHESFVRSSAKVHSPISKRRARRLMRFAILSIMATVAGIGLLAVAMG